MTAVRRHRRLLLTVGVAASLTLAACGGNDAEDTAADSSDPAARVALTAGLSTTSSTVGQSYYSSVPDYLGYWEDAGLDVEQKRFNGSGETVTAVATNRIDVAHAGNFSNMAAHQNGGAQTVAFMHDIPGNPYFPIVLEDSPIKTLKDFEGKTLGIFSLASDANEMLQGVMEEEGLDASSVNIVATGLGAPAAEALRSRKIDGWMAYDSGAALLRTLGVQWRTVEPELFEDFGPGSGMIAQPETLEKKRDALVKYGQGIAKAMVFTTENPEAAVLIHWEKFPETKPAGVAPEKALEDGVIELGARMENVAPEGDQWGGTTDERFQQYIDIFVSSGALKKGLDVDKLWVDELMTDINDFDVDEVKKAARDFKLVNK